ncbi:MAG: hypothetical protein WCR75_11735, partial [Sphaerochaetaceae bacterium]
TFEHKGEPFEASREIKTAITEYGKLSVDMRSVRMKKYVQVQHPGPLEHLPERSESSLCPDTVIYISHRTTVNRS